MINVMCRTNLDEGHNKKWPNEMACRPMIGDRVQAESGYTLKVVGITHVMINENRYRSDLPPDWKPILSVELNK